VPALWTIVATRLTPSLRARRAALAAARRALEAELGRRPQADDQHPPGVDLAARVEQGDPLSLP
jgi:hypothetical protein